MSTDPVVVFPDLSRADDLADPRKRLIGIAQYCNVLMNCYRSAANERQAQRDTIDRLNIDARTASEFEQMELSKLNHCEKMCEHYHQQTRQLTEAMRRTMPDLLPKCRVLRLYRAPFFDDPAFEWDAMESDLIKVQLEACRQLNGPEPAPTNGMKWQDAKSNAEKHCTRNPFPGVNALATIVGCSASTMSKAIGRSKTLRAQLAEHEAQRNRTARTLTDGVAASARQTREPDPIDAASESTDDAFHRLLEQAKPSERATLNALTQAKRRELVATIEHDPDKPRTVRGPKR